MLVKGNSRPSIFSFFSWLKSHVKFRLLLAAALVIILLKYFVVHKSSYSMKFFDQRISEYYVWTFFNNSRRNGSGLTETSLSSSSSSDSGGNTSPAAAADNLNSGSRVPPLLSYPADNLTATTTLSGSNSSSKTVISPNASSPSRTLITTTTVRNESSYFLSPTSVTVNSTSLINSTTIYSATTTTKVNNTNITAYSTQLSTNASHPLCPVVPPVLVGPIKVWLDYPSWPELHELYPFIQPGGHGRPKTCTSRHRVAIILPYRDRESHLRTFLHNLHSLLTKQQLDYAIFVVEQIANQTFNRAKLMNVGFVEALKMYDFQCFIFHDVDLLPEDDRNLYTCPEQPRHMSVAVDKFGYKLPYASLFGGITALTTEQFQKINGFSNDYWGWGGEDDDLASRVKLHGFEISRYSAEIARYKMIKHSHEKDNAVNTCRYSLMYKVKIRWPRDGLTTLNYEVKKKRLELLYTWILVDLKERESRAALAEEKICS